MRAKNATNTRNRRHFLIVKPWRALDVKLLILVKLTLLECFLMLTSSQSFFVELLNAMISSSLIDSKSNFPKKL